MRANILTVLINNWTDILTAVIAVYAAVLSTINLLRQIKESKPNIRVVTIGTFPNDFSILTNKIELIATNHGEKNVELNNFGFIIPNNEKIEYRQNIRYEWIPWEYKRQVPFDLLPGKACSASVPASELIKKLKAKGYSKKVNIVGFYSDSLGNIYKARPMKVNVSELWEIVGIPPDVLIEMIERAKKEWAKEK